VSAPRAGDGPLLVVYRALGLGDLLTGVPALRALARAFPGHRRVLCAPAVLGPLVALIDGIDALSDTRALEPPEVALARPAVVVNLHGRGPESHRALTTLGPDRLIAFDCPPAGHSGPRWSGDEHEIARWCRLLEEEGIPADAGDLDLPAPAVDPGPHATGATVIHPGAASESRRWPVERWALVAGREAARGRRVVITGSATERRIALEVAERAGLDATSVLAGRTDLDELAAVIATAGRVVCGDTGVGHLATAFGTPSLLLFGPTAPEHWGPPARRSQHVVLWHGRRGDPHADTPDPGLLALGAEEVDTVLAGLPDRVESR